MTQRKSTKHALLMSALSLLLCMSMLIGTTFAWFTDEVTSAGNIIQSGTLKVGLVDAYGNSMEGKVINFVTADNRAQDKILWEPGCTYETEPVYVVNNGNLALKYQIVINGIDGDAKLLEAIDWTVTVDGVETDLTTFEGVLLPGETAKSGAIVLSGHMKEEAGNEYQDLTVEGISITVYATQYTHENDSFGNTYDELADYAIYASQTKMLADGAESVDFALSYEGTLVVKLSVPASAIADTTKPVTATVDGIDPTLTITVGENTKAYAYDIDVTNLKEDLSGDQLVTVTVSAPNALAAMNAYHNGELIEDAVYDEVEGTVTFKTASFSPYAFDYTEKEVSTWEELRAAVAQNNVEIKLTQDITVDLAANSSVRSEDHKFTGSEKTYYNGVNISGENVAIDLNGHTITASCGIDSVNTTGALFFVEENGSLNINDRKGGGTIKMENCFYMVWAPFADPSYVDIYNGIFLADKYANDPMAPGEDAYSENDNRALVYAGEGGNMNIYGGYFLYENTPNDNTNRNNGAFNALDLTKKVCITIHPAGANYSGAKLINAQYKQDPTYTSAGQQWGCYYDAYSIKLKNGCTMKQVTENTATAGYSTWYTPVQSGPDVWNVGFFTIGQEIAIPDEATYQYYARETNATCYGNNGETATGFVNPGFSATDSLAYNYQLTDPATGLGSLTVTGVTKDTTLGFTGSYISFKEYENIVFGYYVDGDLSTFVRCTVESGNQNPNPGTYVPGQGTNCHNFGGLLVDVSGFNAGSNHKITWAVQAVKMINGQKVAYETVDLCVWDITMAN